MGVRSASLAAIGLITMGCVPPHEAFDQRAAEMGFQRYVVEGANFEHAVYQRKATRTNLPLHVYIGGDGAPWVRGRWPAGDPTSRQDPALGLMSLDAAPSLYLGRPCYHGFAQVPSCNSALWTEQRYSIDVVLSMIAALRTLVVNSQPIVLIGYSGGGALAMLMAPMIDQVVGLITIASNLDTAAWVEYHGYRQLEGSLNPAARGPLPPHIAQLHLAGSQDKSIPPALIRGALAAIAAPPLEVLDGVDHLSGWAETWPSILRRYAQRYGQHSPLGTQPSSEISAEPQADPLSVPVAVPKYDVEANLPQPPLGHPHR